MKLHKIEEWRDKGRKTKRCTHRISKALLLFNNFDGRIEPLMRICKVVFRILEVPEEKNEIKSGNKMKCKFKRREKKDKNSEREAGKRGENKTWHKIPKKNTIKIAEKGDDSMICFIGECKE